MRAALVLSLILVTGLVHPQTIDTAILGTITDSTGAVVANAMVTITQEATGVKRQTTSNAEGKYEVRYLVPGEYVVDVRAGGFRTARTGKLTIQINQQARIDVTMQVGDVQESIEVSATTPLLQTEKMPPSAKWSARKRS
jgi:hypothetical protein